jgi:uncharacterized membrane protein YeaQ/YmgE (transglycosylase-associated protein family)
MGDFIADLLKSPFICLGWLIVGALAGGIAHSVLRSRGNLIGNIILGLIGAVVGGVIMGLLGYGKPSGGLDLVIVNLIVATIGAVLLIALGRLFTRPRATM